jgi:hypothetical protein
MLTLLASEIILLRGVCKMLFKEFEILLKECVMFSEECKMLPKECQMLSDQINILMVILQYRMAGNYPDFFHIPCASGYLVYPT